MPLIDFVLAICKSFKDTERSRKSQIISCNVEITTPVDPIIFSIMVCLEHIDFFVWISKGG
jgi:hypothetical protein